AGDSDGDARFGLFDAVADAFSTASQREPLLLVIDDLQWADAASVRLLQFLGRDPRARRLAIVANYRDGGVDGNRPLADAVAELAVDGVHIRLDGLGEGEVSALARALVRDSVVLPSMPLLHRRSGGNPFFVRELVRLLDAESRRGDAERGGI